ncbi:unnamed protein product, partial [Ectocarpus sp. 4 AP-2014]
ERAGEAHPISSADYKSIRPLKLTGKLRCQAMERVAGRTGLSVNTAGAVDSSFDLHTHADNRGG